MGERSEWQGYFARRARRGAIGRLVFGLLVLGVVVEIGIVWAVMHDAPAGFYWGYVPAALLFGAFGAFLLVNGMRYLLGPTHPIYRAMGAHPTQTATEIEGELEGAAVFGDRLGKAYLTTHWLVHGSQVVRLADLVWVYPKSTKYSVNFIPVGKVSKLELLTGANSEHSNFPLSVEVGNGWRELYDAVAEAAPWAHYGYRPEWKARWHEVRAGLEAEARAKLDPRPVE